VRALVDRLCRWHGLVPAGVPSPQQGLRVFQRALVHGLVNAPGGGDATTSVGFNLRALGSCAHALRERLSPEHWKLIHEVEDHFTQHLNAVLRLPAAGGLPTAEVLGLLARAAMHLSAITGAQTDRMTRDDGWRLLSVGRQVERLDMLSHALAQGFELRVHDSDAGFNLLLALFDSVITYRAQFQARREVPPLLHLLVQDTDNPRSLAWVARTLGDRLRKLAHDAPWAHEATAALPAPAGWPLEQLCTPDETGRHSALIAALEDCALGVRQLSDLIGQRLFSHVAEAAHAVWQ
jgi:uncharacterized alpha-E superfamily protein